MEALHIVEPSVQLDHISRTGGLMQPIDVLGDNAGEPSEGLQCGHGPMALVRLGARDGAPSEVAAGPVPLPGERISSERLIRHWRDPAGEAGRTPVVRDARLSGEPGAAEHDHPAPLEQLRKLRHAFELSHASELSHVHELGRRRRIHGGHVTYGASAERVDVT